MHELVKGTEKSHQIADEMTKKIIEFPYGDQNEICKCICENIRSYRGNLIEQARQTIEKQNCEIDNLGNLNKELEKLA